MKNSNDNSFLNEYFDMNQVTLFVRNTVCGIVYEKNGVKITQKEMSDLAYDKSQIIKDKTIFEDSKKYCFFGLVNHEKTKVKNIMTGDIYEFKRAYNLDRRTSYILDCMKIVEVEGQKRPFVMSQLSENKIIEKGFYSNKLSELNNCVGITKELKECGNNVMRATLKNFEDKYNNAMQKYYEDTKNQVVKEKEDKTLRQKIVDKTSKEREF